MSAIVEASPSADSGVSNGSQEKPRRSWGRKAGAHGRPKAEPTIVKTWAFDSVGPRKYALQIKKAANGNPCLKIVEGRLQPDGTYRKFDILFWSEDFDSLFAHLDQVREFMKANNIRTPQGHKYDPNKPPRRAGKFTPKS